MMTEPDFCRHDSGGNIVPPQRDWEDAAKLKYANPRLRRAIGRFGEPAALAASALRRKAQLPSLSSTAWDHRGPRKITGVAAYEYVCRRVRIASHLVTI